MSKKPLIFGLAGPKLTKEEKELLQNNPVWGFILFSRNIQNQQQLQTLVDDLKNLYDYNPLILIDQEGGKVARLRPPIIQNEYPAAHYFGEIYDQDSEEACGQVFDNYSKLMKDLKQYRIDSPCAPVADLQYSWADQVIGTRSFGKEVQKVVDLSKAAIEAIQQQGGIAIIKHIPGHGRANCDSHYHLPVIDTPLEELNKTDFAVFKQLSTLNQDMWAMTAHIIYKAIDLNKPITLSTTAINFIREKIGFKGILITDDICMGALHSENCITYLLVKQLLVFLEKQDTNNPKYNEPKYNEILEELIKQKILKSNSGLEQKAQLMEELMTCLPKLKTVFTDSIVKAVWQALAAGCDLVLHCSGDLQEMTKICAAIPLKE